MPSYSLMVSWDSICLTVSITTETTMSSEVPPMVKAWMPVKYLKIKGKMAITPKNKAPTKIILCVVLANIRMYGGPA